MRKIKVVLDWFANTNHTGFLDVYKRQILIFRSLRRLSAEFWIIRTGARR